MKEAGKGAIHMKNINVLVLGASGFVGSNLVENFLIHGCRVTALDCREPFCRYPGYEETYSFIKGDIRNANLLQKILREKYIEYVIHLAAVSTIQMGSININKTMDINVKGTETVLQAIKNTQTVKGLIYASTDKVYGTLRKQAYTEEDSLLPVASPYDQSKAEADKLVRKWAAKQGIPAVVLRFCNIYGKYDLQDFRIVPHTIKAVLENRECLLKMYRGEDGHIQNFQRDFLYIDDLCSTIWHLIGEMERWNSGTAPSCWGEAFNLGALRCYRMDEVIWHIEKLAEISASIRIELSDTLPEVREQRLDFSKAHKYLGFSPRTSLEDGLRETIRWWRTYLKEKNNQDGEDKNE